MMREQPKQSPPDLCQKIVQVSNEKKKNCFDAWEIICASRAARYVCCAESTADGRVSRVARYVCCEVISSWECIFSHKNLGL